MAKRILLLLLILAVTDRLPAQTSYTDSIQAFIRNYTDKHEVVKGEDRNRLDFYPVNARYRVVAGFERVRNGSWFTMETSGKTRQAFRVYGLLHFTINDTSLTLRLYQSQRLMAVPEYRDLLFLPFTDLTTGEETYSAGRYIDLRFDDITGNTVVIDFNKCYNPYCAYGTGTFNCPIPPGENTLNVAILAGEKIYRGSGHP